MANDNTKTYVDEQRLQQYVDAAIEMYKKMYPSWSEEELNDHIQRNVHDQVNEVTDKIDEINTEIDKYQDKLDQLPEDVTERLVNAEGQIVILNADKNKLTDDIQIITTEQNGLKERCTTVETLSRQIEADVQSFKSEIESKSYVESYNFEEFKTTIQESTDRFSTDIETTKGDVSKINQELETNYVTKEESKDFATGEQVRTLEETTSKTLTDQRGIIDTVTGTMKITSEQQNKLELEVNTLKYDFTSKYNEINNSHQNLVSNIEATYVPKTAIKFDKNSQELTISDVSIPLKDVNINAEGVVEEVEDVKNTVNDAIPAIADALKPSINGDDWISVEEGGSESTYEAPYFKAGAVSDAVQNAIDKIRGMGNQSVKVKFNESKIDEKIAASLSDMNALSSDVEFLKDAIKDISSNNSSIECSCDLATLSSDIVNALSTSNSSCSCDLESLKDAIDKLSSVSECSCDLETLSNDVEGTINDIGELWENHNDLQAQLNDLSDQLDNINTDCSCNLDNISSMLEGLANNLQNTANNSTTLKSEGGGIVITTQIEKSEDDDIGDIQCCNIQLEGFSDSSDDSIELTSSAEVEKETISLLEGDAFLVRSGSTLTYKTISLEIPLPKDYSSDIDDINARLDAMDEYCNHDHTHECDPYIYERLEELAISCEHECDSEIYERLDALESELDPEQPTSLLGRINENSSRIDAIESELNLENNEGLLYRVNENTGRIEDNIRRLDDIEAILIDNGVDPSIATRLATLESIIEASGLDVGEINSVLAELKNDSSLTKDYIANINAKNYEQDDKFSVITAAIEVFSNQIASLEAEIANIKTKLSM